MICIAVAAVQRFPSMDDGFGGGTVIEENLLTNTCRESGDHGYVFFALFLGLRLGRLWIIYWCARHPSPTVLSPMDHQSPSLKSAVRYVFGTR